MGLIQREIEKAGIPTIGITLLRRYTEMVKPPRSIYLRWPFGHPLGEPHHIQQQFAVLEQAFLALYDIRVPGTIMDVPFRWRRQTYNTCYWQRLCYPKKAS